MLHADWSEEVAFWLGRSAWVRSEYRDGRLLARQLIHWMRGGIIDAESPVRLAYYLQCNSPYYREGVVRLIEQWSSVHRKEVQHAD